MKRLNRKALSLGYRSFLSNKFTLRFFDECRIPFSFNSAISFNGVHVKFVGVTISNYTSLNSTHCSNIFTFNKKLYDYGSIPIPNDAILSINEFKSREFSQIVDRMASFEKFVDIKLAQTGEGIAECELIEWFVTEGEYIGEFQPVCKVQSDKASIEITSQFAGKIMKMNFQPGDIVKVGEVLVHLLIESDESTSEESSISDIESTFSQIKDDFRLPSLTPSLPSSSIFETSSLHSAVDVLSSPSPSPPPHPSPAPSRVVLATPAVRNLARDYGIDLNLIEGSGKNGRIMKEDVIGMISEWKGVVEEEIEVEEEALSGGTVEKREEERTDLEIYDKLGEGNKEKKMGVKVGMKDFVIPIRGYRRAMVKSMVASLSIPHFQLMEEMCVDDVLSVLKNMKEEAKKERNINLTLLPFFIKALSMAALRFPIINSSLNESMTEIICKRSYNVGIAMATDHGLVVPNIKDCNNLSILDIAEEIARLRHLAESCQLSECDLTNGTISISNIGVIAGSYSAPLIKSPEVAIIALGRIRTIPGFASDGQIIHSNIINVSMSADHRVIDGATLASFCKELNSFISNPHRLLLHLH